MRMPLFQRSRADPAANVSWFEIKPWACNPPSCGNENLDDYKQLEDGIQTAMKGRDSKFLAKYNQQTVSLRSTVNSSLGFNLILKYCGNHVLSFLMYQLSL